MIDLIDNLIKIDIMRLFRKIIAGLLILIGNQIVYAQWVGIASSNDRGGYSVYVDPDSGVSIGETVNYWFLYDFKKLQKTAASSFLSYEIQLEINCNKQIGRILRSIDYLEPMGTGNPVHVSSMAQGWAPLNPFAKDVTIWQIACPAYPIANAPQWLLVFIYQKGGDGLNPSI